MRAPSWRHTVRAPSQQPTARSSRPAEPAPDVQAALTALGRRPRRRRERWGMLTLRDLHLARARLEGADLTRAWLEEADLAGAVLKGAKLTRAVLIEADLTRAELAGLDPTVTGLEVG
jgi:hypothetical protein